MAWFRNNYCCPRCEYFWEDEWSSACDDQCPSCGQKNIEAIDSEDLSIIIEQQNDKIFRVTYSPSSTAHEPFYVVLAEVTNENLLPILKEIASEIAYERYN